MFGTQETKKGFIQDRQRRSTFSNAAINLRQKIFGADFGFVRKGKLNSFAAVWFFRFDGEKREREAGNLIIEQMQMALTTQRLK